MQGLVTPLELVIAYYLRRRRAAKPARASKESVAVVGSGIVETVIFFTPEVKPGPSLMKPRVENVTSCIPLNVVDQVEPLVHFALMVMLPSFMVNV